MGGSERRKEGREHNGVWEGVREGRKEGREEGSIMVYGRGSKGGREGA